MVEHFSLWQRVILFSSLGFWALASVVAALVGYPRLFSAMGSFALCISFVVFLTDRYMAQESRRHWDSQILTQSRMIWRYILRVEARVKSDPTPLNKLRDQITVNFDDLLAAKAEDKAIKTYRNEMFFSVLGTLQWGFGEMLVETIKGL